MELSEAIRKRRSVRKFLADKDVTDDQIKQILEAAILAPSSHNSQAWRFIVVRDKGLRTRLANKASHGWFIEQVPAAIVVCADLNELAKIGERSVDTFSLQDTAAAIENMLLTMTDLGLASCWVGAFNEQITKEILDLKEGIRPVAILPVGYPAKEPKMPERKPLNDVTEWR